jgi:hypothetical protein
VIDEKLHEVKDDQQREKGAEIKIIIKFILHLFKLSDPNVSSTILIKTIIGKFVSE